MRKMKSPNLTHEPGAANRDLWRAARRRCRYCTRATVIVQGLPWSATTDHIIPIMRGGADISANKTSACYRCNTLKGDMLPDEFRAKYAGLEMPEISRSGAIIKPKARIARKIAPDEAEQARIAALPLPWKSPPLAAPPLAKGAKSVATLADVWPK